MGTRSLTIFKDTNGKEIVVMYRQFDGYPEGHGKNLADFLQGMQIVNGLSIGNETVKVANGMGCLTAQVIKAFKEKAGGIYIYPAGTRDTGEDYIYIVSGKVGQEATIEIQDYNGKTLAKGTPEEVLSAIKEMNEEE